jgi:mono/diheme cytochrome c family protein
MMRARHVIALAILAAAVTYASATASAEETAAGKLASDLGGYEYKTYCAPCHGLSGKGDGPLHELIMKPPADLTQLAKKNGGEFPEEKVLQVIDGRAEVALHGPRDMPVWGDWFDIEARDPELQAEDRETVVRARIEGLTAYVKSIQE